MAMYERSLAGSIDTFLPYFHDGIMGSISATAEGGTNLVLGDVRTAFRVYERYSAFGGNRVSMALSVAEQRGVLHVCVITSGGTQASFFKILPIGEETWLDRAVQVIDGYANAGAARPE